MATKIIVLNNLVIQYDDTKYTDTFDANVGGTQPGEIIKTSNGLPTIRFYDNQVVKILQDAASITLAIVGNHTKATSTQNNVTASAGNNTSVCISGTYTVYAKSGYKHSIQNGLRKQWRNCYAVCTKYNGG